MILMKTTQITGDLITGRNGKGLQTEKALRVNVFTADGEDFPSCETAWLPRSICESVEVWTETRQDSSGEYKVDCFRATVAAWWTRKLLATRSTGPVPFATSPW